MFVDILGTFSHHTLGNGRPTNRQIIIEFNSISACSKCLGNVGIVFNSNFS